MFYDKEYIIGYLTETVMIHQNNDVNELVLLQEKLVNLCMDMSVTKALCGTYKEYDSAEVTAEDVDFSRDYIIVCKTIIKNISYALLHNYYINEDFTCAIGFLDKYIMEGGEECEK